MGNEIGPEIVQPDLLLNGFKVPPARQIAKLRSVVWQMRNLEPHRLTNHLLTIEV